MMNKNIIIWMLGLMLLVSFAYADGYDNVGFAENGGGVNSADDRGLVFVMLSDDYLVNMSIDPALKCNASQLYNISGGGAMVSNVSINTSTAHGWTAYFPNIILAIVLVGYLRGVN